MRQKLINYFESQKNTFNIKKIDHKIIFIKVWEILKISPIFVTFALLNVLLPVFICLIVSTFKSGAYAVMGIGYVTTFQLAYSQIGFTFSVFTSFLIFKAIKNKKTNISNEDYLIEGFLLTIILGFILVPLYIVPSFIYTKFANAHHNTIDSLKPAYEFIFSSTGFILLTTLRTFLILIVNNKKQFLAVIFEFISILIIVILSIILGIFTELKSIGVGLGLSIGSIISITILLIYIFGFMKIKLSIKKIKINNIKTIIFFTWRQALLTFTIQAFKAIALLSLNASIPEKIVGWIPLNFQMARLIWYNAMYLIPFFIMGLIDTTFFYYFKNEAKQDWDILKTSFYLSLIAILVTIIISIIVGFSVFPLANTYTKNTEFTYDISNIDQDIKPLVQNTVTKKLKPFLENMNSGIQNIIINSVTNIATNILKQKFISFNAESINSIINLPGSETYIYLCIYCILYPIGMLLNTFRLAITNKKPNVLLLSIAQALAITFVVEFGIKFQLSEKYYLMGAWSFPLSIIGIIAFSYLTVKYIIKINQYLSNKNYPK